MDIDANNDSDFEGERAMINLDDELAQQYLADCREQLAAIEKDLLNIENGEAEVDPELVNRAFRAVHSVQGGASFFELVKIRELANRTENALKLIRSGKMSPAPDRIRVLLRATDKLFELTQNPDLSERADLTEIMADLAWVCANTAASADERPPAAGHLRILLVEDDFASRLLLQTFLSRYGECHIAVNGKEAVEAARSALERGQNYDLICMDIMMPEVDGREAVRRIRGLEEGQGILSTFGAKIIMTTAVDEVKEVIQCFEELCDAYLMKPIDLGQLLKQMKSYHLVQ
jgi:two-component system, chemotaxis family, chemotaxis protein CheY